MALLVLFFAPALLLVTLMLDFFEQCVLTDRPAYEALRPYRPREEIGTTPDVQRRRLCRANAAEQTITEIASTVAVGRADHLVGEEPAKGCVRPSG